MNNTPLTDAELKLFDEEHCDPVDADFARSLERRLNIVKEALEVLAKLGNGDKYGNSTGNTIAQDALRNLRIMSDTPETDLMINEHMSTILGHAQKLEREKNEAMLRIKELEEEIEQLYQDMAGEDI